MSIAAEPPVRLGVVGGGLIAQLAHLPALRQLDERFEVRALAEPSMRVREALARRFAIPQTHASHEAMLAREPLDAVLVCSPNGTHARVTRDALDAGMHVLVEKPLCLTPSDAEEIVRRAARAQRVVQVAYMKRFDPAYEALLARLESVGRLRLLATTTVDPGIGERLRPAGLVPPDDVPADVARTLRESTERQVAEAIGSEEPGHAASFSEAFLGALVHDVNLALSLLHGPDGSRVTDAARASDGSLAYGAWALVGGARWTAAWMRIPGAATFSEDLRAFGDDGALTLRFPAPYHGSAPTELRIEGEPAQSWRPAANSYVRELEHFHDCISGSATCRTPAADGARDVAFLTDLYRAAAAA